MVEATDFANRDDLAEFRPLNWAAVGRILVEREVSTRPVVVREVTGQEAAQVPFAKDDDVIQTLAPDGADEPLREGVLPRAVRPTMAKIWLRRNGLIARDRLEGCVTTPSN